MLPKEYLAIYPPYRLVNPISADHEYLRPTLRANLLMTLASNLRYQKGEVAIFETARTYERPDERLPQSGTAVRRRGAAGRARARRRRRQRPPRSTAGDGRRRRAGRLLRCEGLRRRAAARPRRRRRVRRRRTSSAWCRAARPRCASAARASACSGRCIRTSRRRSRSSRTRSSSSSSLDDLLPLVGVAAQGIERLALPGGRAGPGADRRCRHRRRRAAGA